MSSPGHAAGEHRGAGGEAVGAGACHVLHHEPQTGLQRGGPPTLALAHVPRAAELARPRRCLVREEALRACCHITFIHLTLISKATPTGAPTPNSANNQVHQFIFLHSYYKNHEVCLVTQLHG